MRHEVRTRAFILSRSSVHVTSLSILRFPAVCGTPPLAQWVVYRCPGIGSGGYRGVSVGRAQGCPEADPDSSSWLQPTHLRALGAVVAAPPGKQSCTAVRSEGDVRNCSVTPGERRKKGRRCSSSRAEIPLQPTVKIMVRQPVLWQTVETPCGSKLLAVACGGSPCRSRLSIRSLTLGRTHSVAVYSQKTVQRLEKLMKDCILWMGLHTGAEEQHEEGAAEAKCIDWPQFPFHIPLCHWEWGGGRIRSEVEPVKKQRVGRFHSFVFVPYYPTLFLLVINFPKSNLFCPWWWLLSNLCLYLDPPALSSYFVPPPCWGGGVGKCLGGHLVACQGQPSRHLLCCSTSITEIDSVDLEYLKNCFLPHTAGIYKAPEYMNVNEVISWLQHLKCWIEKIISNIDLK